MKTLTIQTIENTFNQFIRSTKMRDGMYEYMRAKRLPGYNCANESIYCEDIREMFNDDFRGFLADFVEQFAEVELWPENLELYYNEADGLVYVCGDEQENLQSRIVALAKAIIDADYSLPYKDWKEPV